MKKNQPIILVDSHAHLSLEDFNEDRHLVIQRAFEGGIQAVLCPAEVTEPKSIEIAVDLTGKYKNIIAAAGVHPHYAQAFNSDHGQKIQDLAKAKKIKAVGEIGLDFHYKFSPPRQQEETLRYQLHLAQELDLPVILHSRESEKELIIAIQEEHFTRGGVLHCFTESWKMAKKMMDHNFFISFSGILTFPKAYLLREVAKKIPLEKVLIETDSPYLVPLPYRGKIKRNEPLYVKEVAKTLAEIKNLSLEELAGRTSENFESLFLFEIKNLRC